MLDAFVVRLMEDSPDLHQSRLRELGLHDVVVGFLRSESEDARRYALDYCAEYGDDIAADDLLELVADGEAAVQKFAAARLEAMTAEQLGIARLCRLLGVDRTPWAAARLAQAFSPKDVSTPLFVDTAARGEDAFDALVGFFEAKRVPVPAATFVALLDDARFADDELAPVVDAAWKELGKRTARDIGIAWIQKSLERRDRTDRVSPWLADGMLAGDDLDVDWLKALVRKPRLRALALTALADRRLVAPTRIGLTWLLDLARSHDDELVAFARRMLLDGFEPDDLGGVARMWQLATGKSESVRAAAALYLQAHHPDLGPRLDEAKAVGVAPRLGHDAYAMATVRPLLARRARRRAAARARDHRARSSCAGAMPARCSSSRPPRIPTRARSAASSCSGRSATRPTRGACRRRGSKGLAPPDRAAPPKGGAESPSTAIACSGSPRARTRPRARSR